ncbi:MAG: MFS transporter [Streptosporangiaceae bacterium]
MAQFMDLVDSTITNVALVSIQRNLHVSAAQLEWVLTSYLIAFAVLLVSGGRLGDIYGRQRVFLVGVVGFGLASLASALAQNGAILITSRTFQGAFAGIMVPQVLSSVTVMYNKDERGKIYGLIGMLSALAAVAGLVLGGWMITANLWGTGWRSIFIVNIPICVILVIAALIVVPNSRAEHPLKLDPLGMLLSGAGVFLVEFALIDGHSAHWAPWIWGMLAGGPVLIAIFAVQQRAKLARDGSPLLPMPLFKNRGFSSGLVIQTLFWLANGSYALVIGYYLQRSVGFTPFRAGLTIFSITVGAFIASPVTPMLAKKFGKQMVFLGGIIQAIAFVWVISVVNSHGQHLSMWSLSLPLGLAGVGLVFLVIPLLDETLATVAEAEAGAASGTFNTVQQIGSALGIAIAGELFFSRAGAFPTPDSFKHGIIQGLWVTVVAYLLAGFASLRLSNHRAVTAAAAGETLPERIERSKQPDVEQATS